MEMACLQVMDVNSAFHTRVQARVYYTAVMPWTLWAV